MITLIREGNSEGDVALEVPAPSGSLCEELQKRKVHAATAAELVSGFPEAKIRDQIDFHDWLLRRGGKFSPKDPPAFLVAAIRGNYKPPADFQMKREREKGVRHRTETPKATLAEAARDSGDDRGGSLLRLYALLPQEEQKRIEELAIKNGNRFLVDTYHRLKAEGGKLWEEVRDEVILGFLKSKPACVESMDG